MFKGLPIEKDDSGFRAGLREIDETDLPAGNLVVRVHHSTLNYKEALAITGKSPVVRHFFPIVPGINLVAVCGLAGGMEFPATVAPFILRGIALVGIDSMRCPRVRRLEVWRRSGRDLDMDKLNTMTKKFVWLKLWIMPSNSCRELFKGGWLWL